VIGGSAGIGLGAARRRCPAICDRHLRSVADYASVNLASLASDYSEEGVSHVKSLAGNR
jgi:hypothetical protein